MNLSIDPPAHRAAAGSECITDGRLHAALVHLAPFFDDRALAEITPDDVERYVRVKSKTLAMKTIRNHVNTLHSIFEIGVRKGWCPANPVKVADRPQIKKLLGR